MKARDAWAAVGIALLGIALALAATACDDREPTPPTPPPAPIEAPSAQESKARTATETAQAKVDRLEGELAAAQAEARAAVLAEKRAEERARLDSLRTLSRWVAGIALLGSFACVALAIFLPVGRSYAITGGMACGAVMALALATDRWLPLLPWIGGALVLAGLAWLVWELRRYVVSTKQSAAHGDRLENALKQVRGLVPPGVVDDLIGVAKVLSADAQQRAGVDKVIAAVRGKKPKPLRPTAPA